MTNSVARLAWEKESGVALTFDRKCTGNRLNNNNNNYYYYSVYGTGKTLAQSTIVCRFTCKNKKLQ